MKKAKKKANSFYMPIDWNSTPVAKKGREGFSPSLGAQIAPHSLVQGCR